ncbi:hypothetical protein SAMN05444002_0372 [Vannielia litorea]|uniref:Uncharacterized protein n=2 Tax=Vannielia litorea TaxID=1217970 RepID=A0A1N6E5Z8_9RHOB|nr:hypothetical protein [Vannielia litorea]SIN78439.1 hypothetical protein SAMN05444002_0372 [Vannielia litorea]
MEPGTRTPGRTQGAEAELQAILLRVGRLNYAWTNTESLLIHLIAGLAKTEKDVAVVIFLTLNTTRARVDLVERLAKLPTVSTELRKDVLEVTSALTREGGLRNKYNHCIYSFDPESGGLQTIMMRIQDRKEAIRMGKTERVNAAESASIDASIAKLEQLNRSIWALIRQHDFPI